MMMESNEVIAWTQCTRESSTQWLNILTFILRPFTFVNLLHKLWGSKISQGVSKTSVWKTLFQTVRQYKKISCGIFSAIRFQMAFYSVLLWPVAWQRVDIVTSGDCCWYYWCWGIFVECAIMHKSPLSDLKWFYFAFS